MPQECSGMPATSLFITLKLTCWPFFQPSLLSSCSKYRSIESKSPETECVPWKKECSRGMHASMMTAAVLGEMGRAEVKWEEEFRRILKRSSVAGIQMLHWHDELYNQESIAQRTGQVYKSTICKSCISHILSQMRRLQLQSEMNYGRSLISCFCVFSCQSTTPRNFRAFKSMLTHKLIPRLIHCLFTWLMGFFGSGKNGTNKSKIMRSKPLCPWDRDV